MPSEASLPLAAVYAFLLVLARVSGALIFTPMPGLSASPEPARIFFSLSLTVALYPLWPAVKPLPGMGLLAVWLLAETALGITIGLVVGFLAEAFAMFGQISGLQAGYSFASTVDPNTQADSTVFVIMSQTIAGLLFFALGLHREVLRVLARSLETTPPGSFVLAPATAERIVRLGSTIFSTGLRLAMPVVALLLMVDLALALLGRINAQLQLLILAFPAKMMAALALLAATAAMFPRVYRECAMRLFEMLPGLLGWHG